MGQLGQERPKGASGFMPVTVSAGSEALTIDVYWPNGLKIQFPMCIEAEWLSGFLDTLRD